MTKRSSLIILSICLSLCCSCGPASKTKLSGGNSMVPNSSVISSMTKGPDGPDPIYPDSGNLSRIEPGIIVNDADVLRANAEIVGEIPVFELDKKDIPKILKCLRYATRVPYMDSNGRPDVHFARVSLKLTSGKVIIIDTMMDVMGPLEFLLNQKAYMRTDPDQPGHYGKRSFVSVFEEYEEFPSDWISENIAFKEMIIKLSKSAKKGGPSGGN